MHEARDGDLVTYQKCTDPDCPSNRPGTEHAHLVKLERADGRVVVNTDRDE